MSDDPNVVIRHAADLDDIDSGMAAVWACLAAVFALSCVVGGMVVTWLR